MAPCDLQDSVSKRKRINRLAKQRQSEARREQWPPHEEHKEEKEGFVTNTTAKFENPGEFINAETKFLPPTNSAITWASLLNSNTCSKMHQKSKVIPCTARLWSSESEPDPDLLPASSNLRANFRVDRSQQKGIRTDKSPDLSCSASCEDGSPMGKVTKVCRGSRRSRGHCRNSKENICIEKLQTKGRHGRLEGNLHKQDCPDDGWQAAADALGLHTLPKIFANVLQLQAVLFSDRKQTGTISTSLLGSKPKQQQQNVHGRVQAQEDLHRPPLLSRPVKQPYCGTKIPSLKHSKDTLEKTQCLVCTEDLDVTDTSFEGCKCGFNICLFCYHKIAQESGKCPGCRGAYKKDVTAKPVCLLPR